MNELAILQCELRNSEDIKNKFAVILCCLLEQQNNMPFTSYTKSKIIIRGKFDMFSKLGKKMTTIFSGILSFVVAQSEVLLWSNEYYLSV